MSETTRLQLSLEPFVLPSDAVMYLMPFVIDGRSPTFAVARGACSYQCLKQGQWSHRHNRTNCIHEPAAAHFCACCVPCTAPLPRQRVVFFRGRGRGRGRGHGRGVAVAVAVAGPWLCRVCRWWLGVRMSGCPGGRVGGRVAAAFGGCFPSACIPSSLCFRAFRGIYP